ncbi:MAG: extracellular solute-binding protein [Cytophagales bacterium]|nr:extracellular solute-binding protein [Armatimonadota bacterium]
MLTPLSPFRRLFRVFWLLCLAALLFASAPPLFAGPAPLTTEKTKLVVWGLEVGKESAGLVAQIAEFERQNPDIKVSVLSMGAGSMNPQKLMTSIVGGVPPDVINQDRFTVGDWASRGTFRAVDDFLAKETGANAVRRADFYPATWNEAVYKGKVYAVPTGVDDRLLFYNKAAFRQAGMDPNSPPRTWEELELAAKKLTLLNPDGTYKRIGFIPNYGNSWLYLYSWQNGGEFLSPDARTCTLANPQTIGALSYMVGLYDTLGGNDKISLFQSSFQGGEQNPFYTGKVAMFTSGSWELNNIARYAPDLDFGVVPPPVPAERLKGQGIFANQPKYITWVGGYSLAIPEGSQHPQQAWRFIRFMTSVEGQLLGARAQKAYAESKGRPFVFTLTAKPSVNAALLRAVPPPNKRLLDAQKAFIDLLPSARYRPVTFIGQTLWDGHVRAFDRAVAHAQTPSAALVEQQSLVQKELDKSLARDTLPVISFTGPLIAIGASVLGALAVALWIASRRMGRSPMVRGEALAGYLMAGPWILGFLLLTAGPIVASLLFSLCDYDVLHAPRYIGAGNFRTLFTDDRELLGKALGNVAYLSLYGIPLGMSTGLAIAMLLNMKVRGMNWYRTAFYVPSIVPGVASAVLWAWLLAGDPNKGIVNALWRVSLTDWFGWQPPGWFGAAEWAKPGLIFQGLWGAGGGMILWLAGLQGVPQSLYEAAEIDGASGMTKFRHVTLPMLSPYIFFNLIMGSIGAIQEFDRVYILAGGTGGYGPLDSLVVPVLYLFNNAFRYFKMGYASAIAWVIFVIILALTLVQWQMQKYWVHYENDRK